MDIVISYPWTNPEPGLPNVAKWGSCDLLAETVTIFNIIPVDFGVVSFVYINLITGKHCDFCLPPVAPFTNMV